MDFVLYLLLLVGLVEITLTPEGHMYILRQKGAVYDQEWKFKEFGRCEDLKLFIRLNLVIRLLI